MTMRGIVHGKTIELEEPPRFAEGQTVEVTLRPVTGANASEGLRRAAGAWANLPDADQVLRELERLREEACFRNDPS